MSRICMAGTGCLTPTPDSRSEAAAPVTGGRRFLMWARRDTGSLKHGCDGGYCQVIRNTATFCHGKHSAEWEYA
jgi:hypothetical protein